MWVAAYTLQSISLSLPPPLRWCEATLHTYFRGDRLWATLPSSEASAEVLLSTFDTCQKPSSYHGLPSRCSSPGLMLLSSFVSGLQLPYMAISISHSSRQGGDSLDRSSISLVLHVCQKPYQTSSMTTHQSVLKHLGMKPVCP